MIYSATKEAVESGHKASSVLIDILEGIVEDYYCMDSKGHDGPRTYRDCGKSDCNYCGAKMIVESVREQRGGS